MPDFYFSMSIGKKIVFSAVAEADTIVDAIRIIQKNNPAYTVSAIATPKQSDRVKAKSIRFFKESE